MSQVKQCACNSKNESSKICSTWKYRVTSIQHSSSLFEGRALQVSSSQSNSNSSRKIDQRGLAASNEEQIQSG
jgi:hypothetical protein